MEEFIENLSDVGWWIGVVVVGIAINLVSPLVFKLGEYLVRRLPGTLVNKFNEYRQKQDAQFDEDLKELERRNNGLIESKLDAVIYCLWAVLTGIIVFTLIQVLGQLPELMYLYFRANFHGIGFVIVVLLAGYFIITRNITQMRRSLRLYKELVRREKALKESIRTHMATRQNKETAQDSVI